VVSKCDHFEPATTEYALSVAERLGADILAVSVNTIPEYYDGEDSGRIGTELVFATSAAHSVESFRKEAQARGVRLEHICRAGKVGANVSRLYHEIRHLSFVLLEPGIRKEDIADLVPVPVFTVVGPNQADPADATRIPAVSRKGSAVIKLSKTKGETGMNPAQKQRRKAYPRVLIFGILAVALYAAVFLNTDLVMKYYAKGKFYCLLPVATVFIFSYIHGSFASNVWTALGICASNKSLKKSAKKTVTKTKRPRARATLNA